MTKKQQVLDTIRNLCDLKRLEFGCWVLDRKDNIIKRIAGSNGEEYVLIKGIGSIEKYKLLDICNFEIIGLPVELNHLLLALSKTADKYAEIVISTSGAIWEEGDDGVFNKLLHEYDLALSVEKNLDNPELLDLIYELICKK